MENRKRQEKDGRPGKPSRSGIVREMVRAPDHKSRGNEKPDVVVGPRKRTSDDRKDQNDKILNFGQRLTGKTANRRIRGRISLQCGRNGDREESSHSDRG